MKAVAALESPKLLPPKGIDFSSNGKFMCMLQKRGDCKNWVAIFYAGHDWKTVNLFEVADIWDPVDCKWVMGSCSILVQDNPLESQFILYSAMTGNPMWKHTPDSHLGLGIRNLVISPNAKLIACGLYDTNLVIYNNLTQAQICELDHPTSISLGN